MLSSETLCLNWLESIKENIKSSTYDKYERIVDKYLISFFNKNHLDTLNESILKKYILDLMNQGLSSSMLKGIKNVIKAIYNYYENQYGLNHIDFSLVKIEDDQKELNILNNKQIKQLHQYCLKDYNSTHICILLAIDTGMMIGEICALKRKDIDLKTGSIYVDTRAQRVKNRNQGSKTVYELVDVLWPVKREVMLPDYLIYYLEVYLNNIHDNDYIISGNDQLPDMKTLQRRLNKVENDLGFEMTYKDLRNTFKERCIQSGMNIYSVMEIMGISNMKFTLSQDNYSSHDIKKHEINKLVK